MAERRLPGHRALVVWPAGDESVPESLWITLDGDSLPAQIEWRGIQPGRLNLERWRFERAPPARRFRIAVPRGYAVVEWP